MFGGRKRSKTSGQGSSSGAGSGSGHYQISWEQLINVEEDDGQLYRQDWDWEESRIVGWPQYGKTTRRRLFPGITTKG
ncbi:hypothetical protein Hanom_Chr17g01556161 [Helianthus anomalus]